MKARVGYVKNMHLNLKMLRTLLRTFFSGAKMSEFFAYNKNGRSTTTQAKNYRQKVKKIWRTKITRLKFL